MADVDPSPWRNRWRLWRKQQRAAQPACRHLREFWLPFRGDSGVLFEGVRYCLDECFDRALGQFLGRIIANQRRGPRHRIPLGLILLSRQDLSIEQLRIALAAQQEAGRGKIGEWIGSLGFAGEHQITAALAQQWSCPVLRSGSSALAVTQPGQHIPLALLVKFAMLPVSFAAITSTLHVAFAERVDYSVLYSVEQMTGCRTEPCMALPSLVRRQLESLACDHARGDLTFDRVADNAEVSRIVRSYCSRLGADEVRVAACAPYFWLRLLPPANPFLDLLIRMPTPPSQEVLADEPLANS